jgi:hypothetical protein
VKIQFSTNIRLSLANRRRLYQVNEILDEYRKQGYVLTLRQLYYQLVSRDIIPNNQKEYSKLSELLTRGRMVGEVDWDGIEDRVRVPKLPYSVDNLADALSDTVDQYRLDRQEGQPFYCETWVEKDALSNVLYRVTQRYHIPLIVNRGYSSCSAMYEAYNRLCNQDRPCIILYFGDHDPSGLDMVRDITERLEEFGMRAETDICGFFRDGQYEFHVKHVGLTTAQVNQYSPPPNPAKITDPRAKGYIAEFGNISWELDALPPVVLSKLLTDNIEELIDHDAFNAVIEKENADRNKLQQFIDDNKD